MLRLQGKEFKVFEETVLRKVFPGVDGRKLVDNSNKYPYCIHAQIGMNFPDGLYGGSGSMIGPHHVLTCAHNVYDSKKKHWAESIQVYPAKQGKCAPFGKAEVTKVYVYEDWTKKGNSDFDIALLILNQSIGKLTGWGGISCIKDSYLKESTIHIAGYPGDKSFDYMWTMEYKIKNASEETFEYIIDTFGGQSGSAVWSNNFGLQPNILGVHTSGSESVNYGVRISQKKFRDLFIPFISNTYKRKTEASIQSLLPSSSPSLATQVHQLQLQPSSQKEVSIPAMAFGKAKWEEYFGDVGVEPSLPANIEEILNSSCPFWSGRKVRDTHILVLIPEKVNGRPLTLNTLRELIRNPQGGGNETKYQYYNEVMRKEIGNQPISSSYWALITKSILPSYSQHKKYAEEQALIKGPYTVPGALEIATGILVHYVETKTRLYSDQTYTCCQETLSNGAHVVVGSFGSSGLGIYSDNGGDFISSNNGGFGGIRQLQLSPQNVTSLSSQPPVIPPRPTVDSPKITSSPPIKPASKTDDCERGTQ